MKLQTYNVTENDVQNVQVFRFDLGQPILYLSLDSAHLCENTGLKMHNASSVLYISDQQHLCFRVDRFTDGQTDTGTNGNQYLLSTAKKLFYRSANAIFGEIGRIASKEVVLHLIISKCIPVILYGLEACPLTKSDLQSIDFVINWFFIKLFKTSDMRNVKYCQQCFSFDMPSDLWEK